VRRPAMMGSLDDGSGACQSLEGDFTQTSSPIATIEPIGESDSSAFSAGLKRVVDSMPITTVLAA